MKKVLLSPLFAPVLVFCVIAFIFILGEITFPNSPVSVYEEGGLCEYITYIGYVLALITVIGVRKDFLDSDKRYDYFLAIFLWACALLREMGIQHYLTTTDTTAFKLRFFKNPANPLHEKILSAFILIVVFCVVAYLLIKYFKRIIQGFFKFNTLYWTICTLGGIGIVSKFFDRLPSNFLKMTGEHFSEEITYFCLVIEEAGEATLPLLFALGFIQYHYLKMEKIKH